MKVSAEKGLKFCYPSITKVGNKQKQYILNHLDFNMECGKAIGLIGLNGTGKTTFARVISGLEKIKEGKIWAEKDKELNRKDLMDMSYFVFQDSDYQLFSESVLDEMLLGMEGKDKKRKILKKELAIFEEPRQPGQFIDDEEKVREYLRKNNISKEELEKDFDEIVNQKVLKDWCTIYDSKYSPSNYGDVKVETQWENW